MAAGSFGLSTLVLGDALTTTAALVIHGSVLVDVVEVQLLRLQSH